MATPGLPYRVTALVAGRTIPGLAVRVTIRATMGALGIGVKLLERRCEKFEAVDLTDTLVLSLRVGALPTALIEGLRNTDASTRLKWESCENRVLCSQPCASRAASRLDSASAGRGIRGVVGEGSSYAAQNVRIVSRFTSTGIFGVFGDKFSYAAQNVRIESARLVGFRDVISPMDIGRMS